MTNSKYLPFHEWSFVLLFCCVILLLTLFSLFGSSNKRALPLAEVQEERKNKELHVTIEGAVHRPGKYTLPENSLLRDLLILASPLPIADLSELQTRRKLIEGEMIIVSEKRWITILLDGATKDKGVYTLLSGTRCQDLAEQLQFEEDADIGKLRKWRRYLKEGEKVTIPSKKKKKKSTSNKSKNE